MAICVEVWLRTVMSACENAPGVALAMFNVPDLAVSADERHETHRLKPQLLHPRGRLELEILQFRTAEYAGRPSVKSNACARSLHRDGDIGRDQATRLVICPVHPQQTSVLVVQRDADVIVVRRPAGPLRRSP